MRKVFLPIAGIVASTFILSGIRSNAQQPSLPTPKTTQLSADALEAQIAKLEVERHGLLVEWTLNSPPVHAADKRLAGLRKQLAQVRPNNLIVSAQAHEKAVQEKVAQLTTVRSYLLGRYPVNKDELKYVDNYLLVLHNSTF